jgi:hypothetical protein
MTNQANDTIKQTSSFEQQASRAQSGMVGEMVSFLLHNKKWWLLPTIVVLLLVGLFVVLGATGAAPFIYTIF